METRWPELPSRALELIIGMLGIQDIVNLAKACEKWRKVAVQSLKSVVIDESLPFNGSWKNWNYCNWAKFSESSLTDNFILDTINCIGDLATSLAEITDQIEHLYFSGNFIPARAYRVLLCSQKAIKTLHVTKKPLPSRFINEDLGYPNAAIPTELQNKQLHMVIAEGVLRHEASLEDISICMENDSISSISRLIPFIDVVRSLGDKEEYFPNLRSVTLLSTTSSEFSLFNRDPEKVNLVEELRCTEIFFERTFKENKLSKLIIVPEIHSGYTYKDNVFCNPLYAMLFSHFLKSGKFSSLTEINLSALSIKGSTVKPMEHADLLIQNCPNITHIKNGSLCLDDMSWEKIIKHYGPQLLHLDSGVDAENAQQIAQYCCNLESLGVVGEGGFSCLPSLKNLKKLELFGSMDESDASIEVLARLAELKVKELTNPNFLNTVGQKARNLEVLSIEIEPQSWEGAESMVDLFLHSLEELHCLKELYFFGGHWISDEDWDDDYADEDWRIIKGEELTESILKNQSELKRLHIDSEMGVEINQAILLERMPHCEITFDYNMLTH